MEGMIIIWLAASALTLLSLAWTGDAGNGRN